MFGQSGLHGMRYTDPSTPSALPLHIPDTGLRSEQVPCPRELLDMYNSLNSGNDASHLGSTSPHYNELAGIDRSPILTINPLLLSIRSNPDQSQVGEMMDCDMPHRQSRESRSRQLNTSTPPNTSTSSRLSNHTSVPHSHQIAPSASPPESTPSLTNTTPIVSARASPVAVHVNAVQGNSLEQHPFMQESPRYNLRSRANISPATSSQASSRPSGRSAKPRTKQRPTPYLNARPKVLSKCSEHALSTPALLPGKINQSIGPDDIAVLANCSCGRSPQGKRTKKHTVLDHIWDNVPANVASYRSGKRFLCPLRGCSSSMKWDSRHRHVRTTHLRIGSTKCPHCPKVFKSSRIEPIRRHCKTMHGVKGQSNRNSKK
ncbi:hypothetical protein OBBRIDRAFT_887456 [Obba rivulosa]|uniref:Uncharacterized protein n=1 Tax=Obba rivulosa TaxID=1052685 RepID=A0A8E2DKS2_9APHY|nr:hypothetical protein OBBRIDRAFT_887456 [Obba rivulosa]